ncbi:hypothetical protein LEP1GSC036_0510 [Leptospira weilii str. 2006001853]|uniref:Uncharacterized protein n=1 Tax=Leptospira weilii str. 2006001853 TaxID=1001589 RepID=A0A828Z5B5_9LEPT|nr:hypothetical protein [Leptospira weilii]EKR64845.1 hypothetical protein LEP1GSC036_0510 [Leptospira weilii str. 2006001853]
MKYTRYFENEVLRKRPELRLEWLEETVYYPDKKEDGRIRFWKWIAEVKKYLRVVTLEDGETIHNGFFDRGFKE